jgi:aminoglycoside phosphotransferase (APT) family kinase protein
LIHGEFYASNVLVQTGEEKRVCAVDWEMAAFGPGLTDLAALTAGSWTDGQRTAIALAYHDALSSTDTSWRPSVQEFLDALDCCRLQAALQWLGWASNWTPPPEHRHDWLGDVLQVISRLRF